MKVSTAKRTRAVLALALGAAVLLGRAADDAAERARFLLNFALYTHWPPAALAATQGGLTLCILGDAALAAALEAAAVERRYIDAQGREHRLGVRPLAAEPVPAECRLLYIASRAPWPAPRPGMLLVAAGADAPVPGAQIRLYRKDGALMFDVDLPAAGAAGLRLDPQLLRLAARVRRGDDEAPP